jgi:putative ATP-binding cassette transporter
MKLIRFLMRIAPGLTVLTSGVALLSGACNAGLIALVSFAISHQDSLSSNLVICFAMLGLGKVVTNYVSQVSLARFSQAAVAGLRRDLVKQILAVPLRRIEELGAPRLMVALTEDVLNVSQALLIIPNFAVNLAILAGGALYLSWLSWKVALGMFAFIVLGAIGYRLLIASGFGFLTKARDEEDRLFGSFRALTDGIKELKLHRERRGRFLDVSVQNTTENLSRHNVAAETRFILAQGWSQLLFFALVGAILFLLPRLEHVSTAALTGYVVTTLYLMGPLAGALSVLSAFGRADVALQKIESLGVALGGQIQETCALTPGERKLPFARLELANVTHSYHREREDSHFILGPINLVFEPGELVFLVGGNGSGKSSLAKIIIGLYPPENGELRLNGQPVTDQNRDDFRQLFSAVFADFYLFESLLGLETPLVDAQAARYLEQLHLNHKVKVTNGVLSTTALSQGQRKRLALLTAYLEDRPFYLFDEWASDQDPLFKDIFYRQLLVELKARGKTVLVITHDDRYFHLADRVIKLDYGRIVSEKQPAASDSIMECRTASFVS